MSRNIPISSMLAYEASRKPFLQEMVARMPNVSDDEINQAPVLKWIKQALSAMKREHINKIEQISLTAQNDPLIVDGTMPDPLGEMRRWVGGDVFIQLARGSLQINTGDLVWLPATGGIFIQNLFSKVVDPVIWKNTKVERLISKSGYTDAYKAQQVANVPLDAPVLPIGGRISPLAAYGVRFS